jgi:hypothetical protein
MIRSKKALTFALLSLSLLPLMWSGNAARATLNFSSIERAPSSLERAMHVAHEATTNVAQGDARYAEYAFYHDGEGMWVRSWFQCERAGSVGLMLADSKPNPQRYISFNKSRPAQQTLHTLVLKGDEDCAMQKCWWTFTSQSPDAGKIYAVEESHYFDRADGYWTRNYRIGTGASEESAASHAQPCRWFPRTRVAIITESQSLYVTETKRGRLVLRVYDHKQASYQPTLLLAGGAYSLNIAGTIETFTFKHRGLTYYINVGAGEEHPLAEVFVMKGDTVIQRDDSLSYIYLKKS